MLLFILSLFWCFMVFLVNPIGNFPLNDDWAYGRLVKILLEEGKWRMEGPLNVPFVAQGLWGALFCLPFGFSFTALRFSTLLLGWAGVLATYGFLREIGTDRRLAIVGAVAIATNPIYFALSHTFMTDVPFFAFATLSFFFLVRGMNRDRFSLILVGSLLGGLAILIRQMGFVIPFSFGLAYLVKKDFRLKKVRKLVIPFILMLFPFFLYDLWLSMTQGGYPPSYHDRIHNWVSILFQNLLDGVFFQELFDNLWVATVYLGLFLTPFLVLKGIDSVRPPHRFLSALLIGILLVGMAAVTVVGKKWMPLSNNILFEGGIGPTTVRDVYVMGLEHVPTFPKVFWMIVTFLGITGGTALLFLLISSSSPSWQGILCLSASFFCLAPYLPTWFHDRYLLFLLPLLMGALMIRKNAIPILSNRFSLSIAIFLLAFWAIFSVATTHDYLAWNRARWEALRVLTEEMKINPKKIDGGYEFNGWFDYQYTYQPKKGKSWWWIEEDLYVVSLGPIPGYEETRKYPYSRWLPCHGQNHVFILRHL